MTSYQHQQRNAGGGVGPPQFTFQLPQSTALFGSGLPPPQSQSPAIQLQPFSMPGISFNPNIGGGNPIQAPPMDHQFYQSSPQRGPPIQGQLSHFAHLPSQASPSPILGQPFPSHGPGYPHHSQSFSGIHLRPASQNSIPFGAEIHGQNQFDARPSGNMELFAQKQPSEHPKSKSAEKTKDHNTNLAADIVEVFEDNFFEELEKLQSVAQTYNYVAMDTEFPGDVYEGDSQYLQVRENVNNLKLIQLGITLSNEKGEFPSPISTWQFNFKFDLKQEKWNRSSIKLLMNSGINFEKLCIRGISHQTFAEYFLTCGMVMNRDVHWYGFHTDHDFGYLYRILSGLALPYEEKQFLDDLMVIFPNFYDIKVIADNVMGLYRGSLASLSERLGVVRDDLCEHQAGSDSKITAKCFIELAKVTVKGNSMVLSSHGEIFGLSRTNRSPPPSGKEQAVRLLAGANIKQQFYESSQEQLYETQSNSISPPIQNQPLFTQDPAYPVGMGGFDFDNGLDFDSAPFEEEDTYFYGDSKPTPPSYLPVHPGLAAQFGATHSMDYNFNTYQYEQSNMHAYNDFNQPPYIQSQQQQQQHFSKAQSMYGVGKPQAGFSKKGPAPSNASIMSNQGSYYGGAPNGSKGGLGHQYSNSQFRNQTGSHNYY